MTDLDPKALWQDQPTEATTISLDEIKRRARWSVRIIALRNGADYFAFIFGGIFMLQGAIYLFDEPALRVASTIGAVAMAAGSYVMWKHASALAVPDDANASDYLAFQRNQLSRQLEAIRASWLWYLAPVFVVMAAYSAAFLIFSPTDKAPKVLPVYIGATIAAIVLTLAMNAVRAWRLKRMLRALEDPS